MSAEALPISAAPRWPRRLTRGGTGLIAGGALLAALAGPINRFGIVDFRVALPLLGLGLLLLLLGMLFAIAGLLGSAAKKSPAPRGLAAIALLVALGIGGYLVSWIARGRSAPLIHEVSTDLADPPSFVAVKEIRDRIPGLNPSDYVARVQTPGGTIDVAARQREAYPDLRPLVLQMPAAEAFRRVEAAARELGWEVVAAVPAEGRFEATDRTFFFGFSDDVVVRLRAEGDGTRVDVRSKSRVGMSDIGKNATRVREFLALLR